MYTAHQQDVERLPLHRNNDEPAYLTGRISALVFYTQINYLFTVLMVK